MKRPDHSLRIGITLAAAVFATLLMFACAPQPHGPTLIYEVDRQKVPDGQKVDMDQLAKTILRRVNRWDNLAYVSRMDDQRIEVALIRQNHADLQRVKRLLAQTGTLEFRILANSRDDKKVIDLALADPSKMQILDNDGNLLAWWVPVKAGEENSLTAYPEIAQRTRKQEEREITEVLVIKDVYDVTGAYLTHVEQGIDQMGRPCVYIAFNSTGGQLLSRLTGDHLPDKSRDFTYRLGIILDGVVYSAPSLGGMISDNAEINGSFTEQEVQDLVSMLSAGTTPRLRLVETKATHNSR